MPVIDLRARDGGADSSALIRCDVCIVGTGPAGATLAGELSTSGLDVTILESGAVVRTDESDALNEVESVGRPRVGDQWTVRNRILGGSSDTWGGRCAPFDEIDYEERPWVPHSGWPVTPGEIGSYLHRSAAHLGLAVGDGYQDERFFRIARRPAPRLAPDRDVLEPFFWQFSRDAEEHYPFEYVRFGRHLAENLGPTATLVLGATAVKVDLQQDGRTARAVRFVKPDGTSGVLLSKVIVLCAGGIENARLLLASNGQSEHGIGNGQGNVGRFLMDHLRGPIGSFDPAATAALQRQYGRYNVLDHLFRAGLRLSPRMQREGHLLNCAAWLGETRAADDPWDAMRRIVQHGPTPGADVRAVLRGWSFIAQGVPDYLIRHNGVPRKLESLDLVAMVEQVPDADSRVTLSARRDALGMPLPVIDWRSATTEAETLRRMGRLVEQEFGRIGLPKPVLAEWIRTGAPLPADFLDVAHPTGTTRMSADPTQGVVDADCRVHGVDGLYVAGSSVFPTSSHCNPTQMIVALAIRTADHIRSRPRDIPTGTEPRAHRMVLTGGSGRIGRVLLRKAVDAGWSVTAVARQVPTDAGGADWVAADLAGLADPALDALLEGADAVVHLAAEQSEPERMEAVNALGTARLAAAAERAGVLGFCYVSTVAVYGSSLRPDCDEDAPVLTPDRDRPDEYLADEKVRAYGRTKLLGELAIRAAATDTAYTILRPSVVVGVQDLMAMRSWSRTEQIVKGHRHAHHVSVEDVTAAALWAIDRSTAHTRVAGQVETFNVAQDEVSRPTVGEFLRDVRAAIGDRSLTTLSAPGAIDHLRDLARFRSATRRNPLWSMRFPNGRIRAAGFRFSTGVEATRARALAKLQAEVRA